MKITLKFYDQKITIENEHDDLDMETMIAEMIKPLLLAMRFNPDTVDEYLGKE